VLAEAAGEVAAGRPEREHRATRQEVVERLLLDRVDAEPARAAVCRQDDRVAFARADEAEPMLPFAELAGARAHVTLDPPVVEPMPVPRRNRRLGHLRGLCPRWRRRSRRFATGSSATSRRGSPTTRRTSPRSSPRTPC